jgi:putative ABC transport system ATP-binding protein
MSLCEVRDLWKTYGSGPAEVHAVHSVNIQIEKGEFTAFVGPSGSGKTSLLNQIGCLDRPTRGDVVLEGRATRDLTDAELSHLRAQRIGFIFQSFNLIPVLTALENVELSLQLAGLGAAVDRSRKVLAEVGLSGLEGRRPNQLSGGQQQRVAVARALVKEPALVIADEPTANLDSTSGKRALELMRDLNERLGVTFLFSTHDRLVMEHARRIVVLRDGAVVEDRPGGSALGIL